ncbi:PilN domain-containing protein [Tepidanaerobacter sp. EBM-38]|uniref:PilN domain-containing protein n=1 Tax=Tepidanaerobacter sp. EBM-38 TaxID=1918496 RepID=UPI000B25A105|nr:PilN domain-containing protein [Tepidanaerobacter sp. EBM-38]
MHRLNLLPTEVLINQSKKKHRLFLILIVSAFLVSLICILMFIKNSEILLKGEIENTYQDIADIKTKMQSWDNLEAMLEECEKRQNIYENLTENRIDYSQILSKLISLIPEETTIISLKIDESSCLIINGYAPYNRYVAEIMEDVKSIDDISDVSLGFILYKEDEDKSSHSYYFEIVAELAED